MPAKIYLILPTYQEKDNITKLVPAIFAQSLPNLRLLLIDDNSPDGTAATAEKLARQYPITVIKRPGKLGLGSAYLLGWQKALAEKADYIGIMDADWSHQPKYLPLFLAALQSDYDVVIGSRYINGGAVSGWSRYRLWQSRAANWFARHLLNLQVHDVTSGFRLFRAQAIANLDLSKIKSNGYSFQEEIVYLLEKNKSRIKEVPITFYERRRGRSKLSKIEIIKFFFLMFRLKWADLVRRCPWLPALLVFLVFFNLFLALQINPNLYDPDAFYHLKMAELIKSDGLVLDFPWQQFSVLKENFADHHLLYHLYLIPFISVFDSLVGIKVAQSILNALLFAFFYHLARREKFAFVFPALLIIFGVHDFIFRLTLLKASPLALLLLFLGFYCLRQKRYLYLFLVSFLYVWSHGGFILLFLIAGLYSLSRWRQTTWRPRLSGPAIVAAGLFSGLIINPYFPQNLNFYWQQLIQIGLFTQKEAITVGAEWYSPQLPALLFPNDFIFIALLLAAVLAFIFRRRLNYLHGFLLTVSLLFLIATLRSVRYIEYFVPWALLFCLSIFALYWASPLWPKHWQWFKNNLWRKKYLLILTVYFILCFTFIYGKNIYDIRRQTAADALAQVSTYSLISQYLSTHSAPGAIVFHTRWDEWPRLFYHNSYNYYLIGLDPTFLYNYDRRLYALWQDLAAGQYKEASSQMIKSNFRADYIIISDYEYDRLLLAYLKRDPQVQLIYAEQNHFLFQITTP